jgi:hypothetical protein
MAISILEYYNASTPQAALKQEFIDASNDTLLNYAISHFFELMPDSTYCSFISKRRSMGFNA